MSMKYFQFVPGGAFLLLSRCALCLVFAASAREGRAMVPFMDGGIFVHVEAMATHDTNIFANAKEEADSYLTLIPAVEYRRTAGTLHLQGLAGVEVQRFFEFSGQDTEDLFASLNLTTSNRPGRNPNQLEFDIEWMQRSTTREDIGLRTRSDDLNAFVMGRKQVSDRLGLRGTASYGNEQFRESALSEIRTWSIATDGVHIYSDNLETFIGYRYRHTETEGVTRDSLTINDHLLQIGAEGQLSARIIGLIAAGVQQRTFEESELNDQVRPYGTASLTWTPRSRSEFVLLGLKDFAVTPDDRSVDQTKLRLILKQGIYRGFSMEPQVSYANVKVERSTGRGRQDDRFEIGMALIYDLASGASTALRYSYRVNASDDPLFDYGRHILELSARMTF